MTRPPGEPPDSLPEESSERSTAPWGSWEPPGSTPGPPAGSPQPSGSSVSPDWGPPVPDTSRPWGNNQNWAPESQRWAAASRPGVVPLRPLSVGEILDGAITYIRRNPLATLGTAAVLTALSGTIQTLILAAIADQVSASLLNLTDNSAVSNDLNAAVLGLGQVLGLALGSLVSWVIGILATGMLTVMMGAAVLGRRIDISMAWRTFLPRLPALLWLTILVSVATFGVFGLGIAIAVLLVATNGFLGLLIALPIVLTAAGTAIWLWVRLLLAPVVLVLEKTGPKQAWRRSMALVKTSWWRVFGIQLLATVIAAVIAGIVSVPFETLAGVAMSPQGEPTSMFWFLVTIGSVVAGVITLPFTSGVVSLLYVDRRMRREGLDLILRSPAAGTTTSSLDGSPDPTDPQWLTVYRAGRPAR